MTIAVCVKVHDGVVLAADSASSLIGVDENDKEVVLKAWMNASKVFNLRKGLPLGATAWGAGAIGPASMSTLMKDLRRRFTGEDLPAEWLIDPANYEVEDIAKRVRTFIFEERYVAAYNDQPIKPSLGIFVAGYSVRSGKREGLAEVYRVEVDDKGQCHVEPTCVRGKADCGIDAGGAHEAVLRLRDGFSPQLRERLEKLLTKAQDAGKAGTSKVAKPAAATPKEPASEAKDATSSEGATAPDLREVFDALRGELEMANKDLLAPMPIRDAIELANFLASTAAGFSRFSEGRDVVGGAIETAAITKHEGFKWVTRKYFFDRTLNPDQDDFTSEVSPSESKPTDAAPNATTLEA